ncbi:MAG: hypothetical protein ACLQLC_07155 [Candidatus Sulfotelmatobacter sp.]
MEQFSIPDRLEPVVPTENARRQGLSSDQRRQRNQKPLAPQPDDDSESSKDGENPHNVDEFI